MCLSLSSSLCFVNSSQLAWWVSTNVWLCQWILAWQWCHTALQPCCWHQSGCLHAGTYQFQLFLLRACKILKLNWFTGIKRWPGRSSNWAGWRDLDHF
jgi:hypothetical protein